MTKIKFLYIDPVISDVLPQEEHGFVLNSKGEVIGYRCVEFMTVAEYLARYGESSNKSEDGK